MSSLSSPKLIGISPSCRFLNDLLRGSFSAGVISLSGVLGSRVLRGLINFPITGGIQELSFSFKDKKFNPKVFLGILKIF